ncbi:hypothetical protein F443_02669 [Plasmopara halstedii]|uniref:RRM domain-containing protein n=1 Tax=Plasmopara halstedii TaxID=4781 RepID=A0A0P1AX67_PLAHL|nr:hypothetical protein F443_02669 [Plasmopara halstedii]CEG45791.1 hypothetical protein F443_02669 [Plasmopara halstedii]|eukprot:XP_024582160.1 hypothetical protein F443_02669 [Plasmopara halstedii]
MATVFVRNLPYGVTQEELEHVFSEIGPVKKIDVIKDKGKRKSEMLTRGFAFVKFAVESDAAAAVVKLNRTNFQGRKMLIDYAMEKGKRRAASTPVENEQKAQEKEGLNKDEHIATTEKKEIEQEQEAVKMKPHTSTSKILEKEDAKDQNEFEKVEDEGEVKAVKVKVEPRVETMAVSADKPTIGHKQSERNVRRRQHREFLRNLERRKEEEAAVQQKSVLIFGFGAHVTKKHVLKKMKKIGSVEKVELKQEARSGKTYALVQFQTTKEAALAISKLDCHIFKGSILQVKSAATTVVIDDQNSTEFPRKLRGGAEAEGLRLIVRNLAFQTSENDLENLFKVYGPLFEVRIVRMPVELDQKRRQRDDEETTIENVPDRSRGFGFVQYRDVADARAAVENLNGTKLKGREMIVDFALSKQKYTDQQKKLEKKTESGLDEYVEETNSGNDDDDKLVMAKDDEEDATSDDSGIETEKEDLALLSKEDTEAQRERTLFIRNVSFQTSEDGLREFFQKFGAVEYARVVHDKGSGLSKGVGFVRFKSVEVASNVLKRGEQLHVDETKKHKKEKKAKVLTLSVLANSCDDALTLDGRQLILSRAVSKTDAEHLTDSNARERRRLDKRNLYLAYEGTLNVNKVSDAELELPKMDIDKRRRAIREKKLKLQNPMYFVSPLRLSVRNLSIELDDRSLKKLFHDAATAGVRAGNVSLSDIKPELASKGNPPVKVRMAKVVRDMEAVKAGKEARSRGYGFVEFSEHVHALAALRVLNNNPKYTSYAAGRVTTAGAPDSSKSRLIVEFALENHGKLKLREKRAVDAAKKREEERLLKEAQGVGSKDADKLKKSRGQRQREKKKLCVQVKAEAKAEVSIDANKSKKEIKVKEVKLQSKRKRAEFSYGDAEVDVLASLESNHLAKKGKTLSRNQRKHAKDLEKEKSFDELVQSYKNEIFGELSAVRMDDKAKPADRWFD